jgi:hypothetical protein
MSNIKKRPNDKNFPNCIEKIVFEIFDKKVIRYIFFKAKK